MKYFQQMHEMKDAENEEYLYRVTLCFIYMIKDGLPTPSNKK